MTAPAAPSPADVRDCPRILVVKLGAFGDLVLAEGALHDIRLQHPDAHVSVLTRRAYAPLLRRCPWVDAVIADDNAPRWRLDRMLALRRTLRAGGFTCAYDLQNSRRSQFYRRLLGDNGCSWCVGSREPDVQLSVPERHARQLHAAGVATVHSRHPAPGWIADDVSALMDAAAIRQPFVVLLPGSSARHQAKRWPHYAACSRVLEQRGIRVVTIPGPDEPGLGLAGDEHYAGLVLRMQGRALDLHALAGVLQSSACVVGNDSGPTHLASCLGTPCVALFSRHSAALVSTGIGERATVLVDDPIESITVDTVVAAVLRQPGLG